MNQEKKKHPRHDTIGPSPKCGPVAPRGAGRSPSELLPSHAGGPRGGRDQYIACQEGGGRFSFHVFFFETAVSKASAHPVTCWWQRERGVVVFSVGFLTQSSIAKMSINPNRMDHFLISDARYFFLDKEKAHPAGIKQRYDRGPPLPPPPPPPPSRRAVKQ